MLAVRQEQRLHRSRYLRRDGVELCRGAVLVVFALDGQNRAGDGGQMILDVPAAELGVEPDVVPAAEGAVDVAVIAREAGAQIGRPIRLPGRSDAGDGDILDEDMRRLEDEAAHGPPPRAGMDEGDRGAVAVADEDGIGDGERVAQRRQRLQRLDMHVVDAARLRERVRLPVTEPRIDQRGAAGRLGKARRKIAPLRKRAEPLMEQDQRRCVGVACGDQFVFEAVALDSDERHQPALAERSRSLKRWILPVAVFGSSATYTNVRGHLYGARHPLTWCRSISVITALTVTPGLTTMKAAGLIRPSA